MSEVLSQIMRETSSSGCADSGSVGTTDLSFGVAQSQSQDGVGTFEKPKFKKNGFLPYIKNGSVSSGGDGCGGKKVNDTSALAAAPARGLTPGPCSLSSNKVKKTKVEAKLCEKCAESGVVSKLRLYQIHIHEAILMCENEECTFSLTTNTCVVPRNFNSVKRLRRKLPASYRSLPASPALSASSGSSGQGTETGASRSSSPLSHTASDSYLLRQNHSSRSSHQVFPYPGRPKGLCTAPSAKSFTAYTPQKTEDDLASLLAGVQDVDFLQFTATSQDDCKPEPGQFSNALEDLFDMEANDDDFEVPLDKGDVGGGPARGQPGSTGDGLSNGNGAGEQGVEMVVQGDGPQKVVVGGLTGMDQAVSSSTAMSEGGHDTPPAAGSSGDGSTGALLETGEGLQLTEHGEACTSSDTAPQESGPDSEQFVSESAGEEMGQTSGEQGQEEASSSYDRPGQEEFAVQSSTEGEMMEGGQEGADAYLPDTEGLVGQQEAGDDVSTTGERGGEEETADSAYVPGQGHYQYGDGQYEEEGHIVDVSQEAMEAGYEEAQSSGQDMAAESDDDVSQSVDEMAAQVLSSMPQYAAESAHDFAQPQYHMEDTAPQTSGQFAAESNESSVGASEAMDISNQGEEQFVASVDGLADSSQQPLDEESQPSENQAQDYGQFEDMLHGEAQGEESGEGFQQQEQAAEEAEPEVSSSGVEPGATDGGSQQAEEEAMPQEHDVSPDSHQLDDTAQQAQEADVHAQQAEEGQAYQYAQEEGSEAYPQVEGGDLASQSQQQPEAQQFAEQQPEAEQFAEHQPEAQQFEQQPETQHFEQQPEAQHFEQQPEAQEFVEQQPEAQHFDEQQPEAQQFVEQQQEAEHFAEQQPEAPEQFVDSQHYADDVQQYQEGQHYQEVGGDQAQYQYMHTEAGYQLVQHGADQYQEQVHSEDVQASQQQEVESTQQPGTSEHYEAQEGYTVQQPGTSEHYEAQEGYTVQQPGMESGYQQVTTEESVETYQYDPSQQIPGTSGMEYGQQVEDQGVVQYSEEHMEAGQYQVAEEQVTEEDHHQQDTSMEVDPSSGPADMLAAASEIAGVNASEDANSQDLNLQDAGSQEAEGASDSENEEFVPVAIETRRVAAVESEETEVVSSGIQHMAVGEAKQRTQPQQVILTSQGQNVTMLTSQGQPVTMMTTQGQPLTLMTSQGQTITMVTSQGQKIQTLPASLASQLTQVVGGRQVLSSASLAAVLQRHLAQQQAGAPVSILQAQPVQQASILPQSATSLLRQASIQSQQQQATPGAAATSQPAAAPGTPQQPPQPELPVARILQDAPITATGQKMLNLYVQWQNVDALCWLDVLLCPLVHSPTLTALMTPERIQGMEGTILTSLFKAYRQAQGVLLNLLNRAAKQDAQARAEKPLLANSTTPTVNIVNKANIGEIGQAVGLLYTARENIWKTMQPRLRCEKGKHDSPVFAMPLLVRENPEMKRMFTINYRLVFHCEACNYTQDDKHHKIMPSLPSVPDDFSMAEPCFVRPCFQCQAPNQRMRMIFENVEDFFLLHFVNGIPHNRFQELDFSYGGSSYTVTSVVQYKRNPDHFICWIRNAPDHSWMECDDLKSVLTRFQPGQPCIPPSQVHIVMWERNITSEHARQFVNTPHTNLLASLVLTVQYPSSAPSSTAPTATAPATAGTTASTATIPAGMQSSSTQSPIQRVMYPSLTSAPRGRGRGRGGRGRGKAASTNIIRRPGPQPVAISAPLTPAGAKQVIYTMGAHGAQPSVSTPNRIVVLKTGSGGMSTLPHQALSPAIIEALKKQGVNLSNVKVVPQSSMLSQSSMGQPIPLASIMAKPAVTATATATYSHAHHAQHPPESEASEAAAALVSSMQEEVVPQVTSTTHSVVTSGIQIHTVTSATTASSFLSQGTSLLTPGHVLAPSTTVGPDGSPTRVRSLLSSALTSHDSQGQQPFIVRQVTTTGGASPTKLTGVSGQGSMLRIMSSGGKAIQVTPVSTTTAQGRRVVMLAQPGTTAVSRAGINIVHPAPISSGSTTNKYQLITKPDGTRVLTQISSSVPTQGQTVTPAGYSSMRVALEGEGGTRLISISSPSRAHQQAADSLTSLAGSLLGAANTSPSSMVGTPLLEAKSSNIRTSIVDTVMTTSGGQTSANPIVISPQAVARPRTVSITTTPSTQLSYTSSDAAAASQAAQLLDIRQHLTYRSDPQQGKPVMASPKQTQKDSEEEKSDNEAELDLAALGDDDWQEEREFRVTPKRGRGSRGGRARGGRGRARGGRGRGGRGRGMPRTVMEEMAPEDVYGAMPNVVRAVNIAQNTLPTATFPAQPGDMADNTDSSSSLPHDVPTPDLSSVGSMEMSDVSQNSVLQPPQASVVTEAVRTIEVGSGDNPYASAQFADSQMEVVEEELVAGDDMQVVEQEVTVGEEIVCTQEEVVQEVAHTEVPPPPEDVPLDISEPSIMGRKGRRRQSGGQSPARGRRSSGSSSPRGGRRRKASEGTDEMSALQAGQMMVDLASASPAAGVASPTRMALPQSPAGSPVRAASQSPVRAASQSPTYPPASPTKSLLAASSPQKSPPTSPARGLLAMQKSPSASPARMSKSPYASPVRGPASPAMASPSRVEMPVEESIMGEEGEKDKTESSMEEQDSEEHEISAPPKKRGRGQRRSRGRGGRKRGGGRQVMSPVYPAVTDEATTEAHGDDYVESSSIDDGNQDRAGEIIPIPSLDKTPDSLDIDVVEQQPDVQQPSTSQAASDSINETLDVETEAATPVEVAEPSPVPVKKRGRGRPPKKSLLSPAQTEAAPTAVPQVEETVVIAESEAVAEPAPVQTEFEQLESETPVTAGPSEDAALSAEETSATPTTPSRAARGRKKGGRRGRPPGKKARTTPAEEEETTPVVENNDEIADMDGSALDVSQAEKEEETAELEPSAGDAELNVDQETEDVSGEKVDTEISPDQGMEVDSTPQPSESPAPAKRRGRPPKSATKKGGRRGKKSVETEADVSVENADVSVQDSELEAVETSQAEPSESKVPDSGDFVAESMDTDAVIEDTNVKDDAEEEVEKTPAKTRGRPRKLSKTPKTPETKIPKLEEKRKTSKTPKTPEVEEKRRTSRTTKTPQVEEEEEVVDVGKTEKEASPRRGGRVSKNKKKDMVNVNAGPSPLVGSPARTRDNIFDIMSDFSQSDGSPSTSEVRGRPSAKKDKLVKAGRSPKSADKKNKDSNKDGAQKAVVKRRSVPVSPQGQDFSFASPSTSKAQSKKTPATHSRSGSEEAVVIRRKPRPLPSPDNEGPPLSSIISPARPPSQADYSQGYSSVVVKRRRTADWAASNEQHDRDSARMARFSSTSFMVDDSFSGAAALNSVPLDNGDGLDHSDSSSPKPKTKSPKSAAKSKSPKVMKQSRTKVRASEYDFDSSEEDEVSFKETVYNHGDVLADKAGAVDSDNLSSSSPLPRSTQSDSASTPTTDSSIRRSSRPVVPSQKLLESSFVKRRRSSTDFGEPPQKKNRTGH